MTGYVNGNWEVNKNCNNGKIESDFSGRKYAQTPTVTSHTHEQRNRRCLRPGGFIGKVNGEVAVGPSD